MRVPDARVYANAASRTMKARSKIEKGVEQVSTGLRVAQPWDDPAAARTIAIQTSSIDRYKSLERTTGFAVSQLRAQDNAMGDVAEALTRSLELAVQMSNDSFDENHRADAAVEVRGIFDRVIAALNHEQNGRYLFAGSLEQDPPFDANGNYLGDTNMREMEAAPGVTLPVSIRADLRMTAAGGGVDVPTVLNDLKAALEINDRAGVQATIDGLHSAIQQTGNSRAEIGRLMLNWEGAQVVAQNAHDELIVARAKLSDMDLAEASTNLAMAERAFEAAITASAKGFELSLLKRL